MTYHLPVLHDPRRGWRKLLANLAGAMKQPFWCIVAGHRWIPAWWLHVDGRQGFICARCGKEFGFMRRSRREEAKHVAPSSVEIEF